MQRFSDEDPNSGSEKHATMHNSRTRDALCDAELKECQRKLQEYKIKGVLPDADKLRATMKARSVVYGRMADIYSVKEDRSMACYYRLLVDAIRTAVAHGELSEQQNGQEGRRAKAAKAETKK